MRELHIGTCSVTTPSTFTMAMFFSLPHST